MANTLAYSAIPLAATKFFRQSMLDLHGTLAYLDKYKCLVYSAISSAIATNIL
jgi:hypothetical protein